MIKSMNQIEATEQFIVSKQLAENDKDKKQQY